MSKAETAMQLTIKALDMKMIGYSSGPTITDTNHNHAKEITDFYNYVFANLESEPTFSFD